MGQVDSLVLSLDFVLPPSVLTAIEAASLSFGRLSANTHTDILHYTAYGKLFLVQNKISPDALLQLAFQMAHWRVTGKAPVSVYESAMTKRFFHGRTECMRPQTPAAHALMSLIASAGSTAIEQLKALRLAAALHVKKVSEAKAGEGVDRHLSGLLNLARIRQKMLPGYEIPELYRDVAWSRLRYDSLSTSNCGGYALASFGFGPVVPDGWGLGYIIKDKCLSVRHHH